MVVDFSRDTNLISLVKARCFTVGQFVIQRVVRHVLLIGGVPHKNRVEISAVLENRYFFKLLHARFYEQNQNETDTETETDTIRRSCTTIVVVLVVSFWRSIGLGGVALASQHVWGLIIRKRTLTFSIPDPTCRRMTGD